MTNKETGRLHDIKSAASSAIEQETRAAVREAFEKLALALHESGDRYDPTDVIEWRDREYPPLPERNAP